MHTELHRRIMARCKISHRGEQHWILTGAATIRLQVFGGELFTTKRVCYAAFVGPVEPADEVFSCCGVDQCIRPEHIALRLARRPARGLSLPDEIEALSKPNAFFKPSGPGILPKDLTVNKYQTVKLLSSRYKNTLAMIREATGLPFAEIVKIQNGVYDEAVKNVQGATAYSKAMRDLRRTRSTVDIPSDKLEGAAQVAFRGPRDAEPPSEEISAEEAEWLRSVGKG